MSNISKKLDKLHGLADELHGLHASIGERVSEVISQLNKIVHRAGVVWPEKTTENYVFSEESGKTYGLCIRRNSSRNLELMTEVCSLGVSSEYKSLGEIRLIHRIRIFRVLDAFIEDYYVALEKYKTSMQTELPR